MKGNNRAATRHEMDWLLGTMQRLLHCSTVESLLDVAYDSVRTGLGYDRVGVLLVDPACRVLVERLGTDARGRKFAPHDRAHPLDGDGYYARLLADPRLQQEGPGYIYFADASRELPREALPMLDGQPSQTLRVALRTAERIVGIMSVDNLTSGRPLTPADAPPLVAFSTALSIALENARLLEGHAHRITALGANLERSVTELEWLREISRRLTEARTRSEVLDIVYWGVRDGLGYDRVGINLFDHQAGMFEDCIGTDAQGRTVRPMDRLVGLAPDSPIWRFPGIAALLRGAEFYYTDDAAAECPPDLQYLFDGLPAHNIMVPLRSEGRVTGMISVDNLLSGRPIVPEDVAPLLALANQVATAVENARLQERERAERLQFAAAAERLRTLYATMACGIVVGDAAGIIVDANEAAQEILGQPLELLKGRLWFNTLTDTVDADGTPLTGEQRPVMVALRTGEPQRGCVMAATRADGRRYWLQVDAVPLRGADGMLEQIVVSFVDITARKQAEARLALQYATAEVLAQSASVSAALDPLLEILGTTLGWDLAALWRVNQSSKALRSQGLWCAPTVAESGASTLSAGLLAAGADTLPGRAWISKKPIWVADLTAETRDRQIAAWAGWRGGVAVPILAGSTVRAVLTLVSRAIQPPDADVVQALMTVATQLSQFMERIEAQEAVAYQAQHDALTGLPNRTLLHDRLHQAIAVTARTEQPAALLLMDLDRFKEVNDTLGHAVGDQLLLALSARVQRALRQTDTAARLGGDEFAILLPATDAAGAIQVAQMLLQSLERPILVEHHTLAIGASIGVAVAPEHGSDASTLLRRADVAMYAAKRAQRGYALYSAAEDDQHGAAHLALVSALRQAVTANEMQLYYQPLVELATGHPIGVEVLLRWVHPEHGLIPPSYFIPVAERTAVIGPLTEWVLDSALAQGQRWKQRGLSMQIAVNLSARMLHDAQLPDKVTMLLQRYNWPPPCLTLEITESALMSDPARARVVLRHLGDLGVRVAIDDFGTGYSSLGYLKELPVHEIKLDKVFVGNLGRTSSLPDTIIIRCVLAMAQALGVQVVAEGVESETAWNLLRSWSCDLAQGYYLSRPLPASELERWIAMQTPNQLGA